MAEPTTPTFPTDVTAFLDAVPDEQRRADAHAVRALIERVTGEPAVMWGASIIGFGSMPYTNSTGTTDWYVIGLSPRKAALTIYGVYDDYAPTNPLFKNLGPHTTGKGCLYLKHLDAVDASVLEQLVASAWAASNH